MISIADATATLTSDPRPVLAFDTCVLLDIIRAGSRGQSDHIDECQKLSEIILPKSKRVQFVVTSLVVREWFQNKSEVGKEATKWLTQTDRFIVDIHKSWDGVGQPLTTQPPTYFDPRLVEALSSLAESLIRGAIILKEDKTCVMRALQRVKLRRRPSHKREIKDSIHLEHYLELSRRLHVLGYAQPIIFVSSNSSDFWADKNTPSQPHADLTVDLTRANLRFYGRLGFPLRHLGILPGVAAGTWSDEPEAGQGSW